VNKIIINAFCIKIQLTDLIIFRLLKLKSIILKNKLTKEKLNEKN